MLFNAVSDAGMQLYATIEEVSVKIVILEKSFDIIKYTTKVCLVKRGIIVRRVADVLTSLSIDEDEQHKMFVKENTNAFFRAIDVGELFGTMNSHWNYLNPHLLDHLIQKLELVEVEGQMMHYKSDLYQFIVKTPLFLFCKTQRRRRLTVSTGFRELVVEFNWPEDITLEAVENFREFCASECNLQECAMLVSHVRHGSFIITWIVPESVVLTLKNAFDRKMLKEHSVTHFEIAGETVYSEHKVYMQCMYVCLLAVA